jgi:hypothetical protein
MPRKYVIYDVTSSNQFHSNETISLYRDGVSRPAMAGARLPHVKAFLPVALITSR